MKRRKIKFGKPEDVSEFVNICDKFISDINVWDGHIAIDAKSMVSMFGIADGKIVEVEMISSDNKEIEKFIDDISKFEVNDVNYFG